MLTKGIKREAMDEHIRFTGGRMCHTIAKSFLFINAVRPSDKWEVRGQKTILRVHKAPREYMFTPMNVAKGPKIVAAVGYLRVTIGENLQMSRASDA